MGTPKERELYQCINYLEYCVDSLVDALGPAGDDILVMVKNEYEGIIPDEYK